MVANCISLLYCCKVRLLSRANVIQRELELNEEAAIFLDKNQNEDANKFRDDNFIVKHTYLVESFGKLSVLIN